MFLFFFESFKSNVLLWFILCMQFWLKKTKSLFASTLQFIDSVDEIIEIKMTSIIFFIIGKKTILNFLRI